MKNKHSNHSVQFIQVIWAKNDAYKHLFEWPKLQLLRVVQVPLQAPNTIAIMGAGKFFDNIFTNELACSCIGEFEVYQEGSCLKELAIYLAERASNGHFTPFF